MGKVNKVFLRTAGAVAIVLASLSARAREAHKGPVTVPAINVPEAPLPPTSPAHHKTAGTPAGEGVIDIGKLEMVTERYPTGRSR